MDITCYITVQTPSWEVNNTFSLYDGYRNVEYYEGGIFHVNNVLHIWLYYEGGIFNVISYGM